MLESAKNTIKKYNMINPGDLIGVGVSGGSDSIALLHFLASLQQELDFEVIAIHIDHAIREESAADAIFVQQYCKENDIRFYKFRVDVPKYSRENKLSIETAARDCRNNVFNSLMKKMIIGKIALAHHLSDQAETILLHLFRGSGLTGARGMSHVKNGFVIRPFLETSKSEIYDYLRENFIPHVEDESNQDNSYSRNFIRNEVLPLIKQKWPAIENSLVGFGKSCSDDTEFIKSQTVTDGFIQNAKSIKIPTTYFLFHPAIVSRTIFLAFEKLGIDKDIERKHIELIKDLYKNGENGSKISLPCYLSAYKEYDYITIANNQKEAKIDQWEHKCGKFIATDFGTVTIKRDKNATFIKDTLIVDSKKIPATAIWRTRKEGDVFSKFGSGTKKLKDFFIDEKIPARLRNSIPVLANGSKILIVAGSEISNDVAIDKNSKTFIRISFEKNNN